MRHPHVFQSQTNHGRSRSTCPVCDGPATEVEATTDFWRGGAEPVILTACADVTCEAYYPTWWPESSQLSGEVRFRREGDQLLVDHATPVMWFARHALESSRDHPDVGLSFDGSRVTLRASNGRWVWDLTGRCQCYRKGATAEPIVMVEGIWPD
jgi:hypothetical protein